MRHQPLGRTRQISSVSSTATKITQRDLPECYPRAQDRKRFLASPQVTAFRRLAQQCPEETRRATLTDYTITLRSSPSLGRGKEIQHWGGLPLSQESQKIVREPATLLCASAVISVGRTRSPITLNSHLKVGMQALRCVTASRSNQSVGPVRLSVKQTRPDAGGLFGSRLRLRPCREPETGH